MSFLHVADTALAFAQAALALMLWHQAEPRMREARGMTAGNCTLALGFVLAWAFPMALTRSLLDATHWQSTVMDGLLVLYAGCIYRRAMTVHRRPMRV